MSTPLTNEQKSTLCQLARDAYESWPGREAFEDANPELSRSKCFEAWRRVEQGKAVGIQRLTACTQDHFLPLRAHWRAMLGNGAAALKDHLRHQEEPRIRVRFLLQQLLDERGLHESYAEKICRDKFKRPLGEASEKQLWAVFFDVKKRRKPQFAARPGRYVKSQLGQLSVTPGNPF